MYINIHIHIHRAPVLGSVRRGVHPHKTQNRMIDMTLSKQNVDALMAGIPVAVEMMKSAALKLYSEVTDSQVPGAENYTFKDYF